MMQYSNAQGASAAVSLLSLQNLMSLDGSQTVFSYMYVNLLSRMPYHFSTFGHSSLFLSLFHISLSLTYSLTHSFTLTLCLSFTLSQLSFFCCRFLSQLTLSLSVSDLSFFLLSLSLSQLTALCVRLLRGFLSVSNLAQI